MTAQELRQNASDERPDGPPHQYQTAGSDQAGADPLSLVPAEIRRRRKGLARRALRGLVIEGPALAGTGIGLVGLDASVGGRCEAGTQKQEAAGAEAVFERDGHRRCSGFAQPGQRAGAFRMGEVPHLGGDKVARELGEVREHRAVADHCDPLDQAMVVADEPQVGGQATEPFPARKGRRLEQEALEPARALDEGVNLRRQGLEVIGGQGSLGATTRMLSVSSSW